MSCHPKLERFLKNQIKDLPMKGIFFAFAITIGLASLVSCHTAKQPTTVSASIVGEYWKLVALNGKAVQAAGQLAREPHMKLSASEKRETGNSGCNSFFGTYELRGGNSISFSKIGATKMACQDDVMEVEHQLFQALETTTKYAIRNDSLLLTMADMSPLATFVRGDNN